MNKTLLLSTAAILLIIAAALFVSDGWIYCAASLIAITIVAVIRHFNSRVVKITRWAKANPRKTQLLITVLQFVILASGILVGYDLKELGVQITGTPTIIFSSVLLAGFLSINFLPKRNIIAIPLKVNRDRIAYMSIALSAFVLMVAFGNRVEDKFPNSPITRAIRSVDQAMFSQDILSDNEEDIESGLSNSSQQMMLLNGSSGTFAFASIAVDEKNSAASTIHPKKAAKKAAKLERKKKRMIKRLEKLRKAFAAGTTVGIVLLIILLIITTCAGICLIAIGGSAGAVILGIILLAASIFGFVKIFQRNKH